MREQAEVLAGSDRAAEAAHLLGTTMLLGGSPGELARPLYAAAEAAWGGEEFWGAYVEIAGFAETAPDMRASWRSLAKLLAMTPGRVVYHAKGWGLAIIEELDHTSREARAKFVSGRRDRFPFQTAIDIFEFLEEGDLRALVVTDPDELTRRLKKEPLEVLRWILERNHGKANQAGIKLAMSTLGVEGARFTAWWRKTKKEAETSEWFELSGPTNRVAVRLLSEAADPVQGIQRQLKRAKSLSEALQRTRALVAGGAAQQEVVKAALATLDELSLDDAHPLAERLGTWIFLREHTGTTPPILAETLRHANEAPAPEDPSQTPELWKVFQFVPGLREQERCIEILQEILGESWLDEAARHLQHGAPGMVRGLVETLAQADRSAELVSHYANLLARPTRNPALLVRLALQLEGGEYDDQLPPTLRRVQCLLQLAVHLYRSSPGDPILTRTRARLTDALAGGKSPMLRDLLKDADVDTLRGFASMISAGVDSAIDRVFTRIAVEHSAEIFREEERPFWELSGTWTYRAGLEKQREELRVLTEEKIPANSEAIGVAASYGDLSENSEWEGRHRGAAQPHQPRHAARDRDPRRPRSRGRGHPGRHRGPRDARALPRRGRRRAHDRGAGPLGRGARGPGVLPLAPWRPACWGAIRGTPARSPCPADRPRCRSWPWSRSRPGPDPRPGAGDPLFCASRRIF